MNVLSKIYYGKRGMTFENMVEMTNTSYRNRGLALVDKVPTPWNVSYDRRTNRVIRAFPEKKGTVDFLGVSHGRPIAFEAKNTRIKTRFDLSNIHGHQVEYLVKHKKHGGIAFVLVNFEKHDKCFLVDIDNFHGWWIDSLRDGRKSIPYEWFKNHCETVKSENGVVLDYLSNLNIT